MPDRQETFQPLRFLRERQKTQGSVFLMASGLSFCAGFMVIPISWYMARIVDAAVFNKMPLSAMMPWVFALAGFHGLRVLLLAIVDYMAGIGAASVVSRLRHDLFRRLYGFLPQHGMTHKTGEILSAAGEGAAALQPYYAQYLPARATMVFLPIAIVMIVYPVDWVSALIMTVTAPMIPFFMILIGRGAEKLNQKQWGRLNALGGHFLEAIQGMTTLKLLNASRRESLLLAESGDSLRRETMAVLRVAFLSSLALEFFATISIALVAVLVGFRLLWGDIPFERGFLVLLLVPEFYLPLRRMGVHYHARMEAIAAGEKLEKLLSLSMPAPTGAMPMTSSAPCIQFTDVSFSYAGRDMTLADINLEVAAGKKTVLVGPSGSGKSTILAIFLGFIEPHSGVVTVNGKNLHDLDLAGWRANIGYVAQQSKLFAGSVSDAIRLGNPAASDADILDLAGELGILGIAGSRSVGEDGRDLSGGQIQRIAFARALIRNAGLLVMDEPTAQMDPVSVMLQQAALKRRAQGKTIVIAAHHLDTVIDADRIYVLDRGRVVSSGTHDDLMHESAYYRRCIEGAFPSGVTVPAS